MTDSNKQVIEVNGVKMEVDMRHAKRVDTFRVGDRVKILQKNGDYGSATKVFSGVIAGFEQFESLPTIIVAYVEVDYSGASVKTAYINADNDKYEIVADSDESLPIEKGAVLQKIDREIEKKHDEIRDLEIKREYFNRMFGKHFAIDDVKEGA